MVNILAQSLITFLKYFGNFLLENFASLTALVIAIWGKQFRNYFSKPILSASIELKSPDCHRITVVYPEIAQKEESYYFRLRISNSGKTAANNVEITVLELLKNEGNGYKKDKDFLPLNLVWAHTHEVEKRRILPGTFKHCDFFHTTSNPNIKIKFDTNVVPNRVKGGRYPTIVNPGKYRVIILIAADDIEVSKFSFDIQFTGNFFLDEKEMFSKKGILVNRT